MNAPLQPTDSAAMKRGLERLDAELARLTPEVAAAVRRILAATASAHRVFAGPKDLTERSPYYQAGVAQSLLDTYARELAALGEDPR